ncbi:MAG: tRNA lysidine(34) synthetase TilS [Candidatus Omnitrophica bacterium]|nr:tRNA lysidine(34) synthetase TilS [Candidatus Omnitrophota bacterium]
MSIQNKFKHTITQHNLISNHDRILIGVSGGPDSVALLCLLNSIKKEFKLDLVIGHLDHGLRRESVKDMDFVLGLGRKLKIPVVCERIKLSSEGKGSLEETARFARLDFFRRVCKEFNLNKVALGHNMDDQAETVLMRVLRGTGLFGLAAIKPGRRIGALEVIRPLLDIERKGIEKYLKEKRVTPVIDRTNTRDIFFRNKIRNRLLPELTKYNPNIKQILANTARQSGDDYDFLLNAARKALRSVKASASKTRVRLELRRLTRCHPAMFRMVLRFAYQHIKGDLRRLTFRHLEELEALVFTRPLRSVVNLPRNIAARKEKRFLSIYSSKG